MLRGLLYAVIACLLWGTTYVIPSFAPEFSPPEILLGRYLVFGFFSLLLILKKTRRSEIELKALPAFRIVITLALLGFFFYDLLEITNIRFNGSETVGLIYGATLLMCPIFINAIAHKRWPAKIDWLNMFLPFCGLLILEWEVAGSIFQGNWALGWGIAILQGILFIYFTRKMSIFTRGVPNPERTAGNITIMIGITCFLLSLVGWSYYIFAIEGSLNAYVASHSASDWLMFAIASLLSGIGTTWLATHLWCVASLRVPYQVLSSLLLADVAAAKIYELMISGNSLSFYHMLGIGILLGSGALIKLAGAHYREDPSLAEISIVSPSADPGILPSPLMEAQVIAYEA